MVHTPIVPTNLVRTPQPIVISSFAVGVVPGKCYYQLPPPPPPPPVAIRFTTATATAITHTHTTEIKSVAYHQQNNNNSFWQLLPALPPPPAQRPPQCLLPPPQFTPPAATALNAACKTSPIQSTRTVCSVDSF